MEIKINKEIREYTEGIFFGLSLRQSICSASACLAAVGVYFLAEPRLGTELTGWLCVLGAVPFAFLGYFRYHGMSAEQFLWVWVKSEFLFPHRYIFRPDNLYCPDKKIRRRERNAEDAKNSKKTEPGKIPDTTEHPADHTGSDGMGGWNLSGGKE